jgi:hypothetical protein
LETRPLFQIIRSVLPASAAPDQLKIASLQRKAS